MGDSGGGRGRDADSPAEIPPPGWKDIAKRTWKEASEDNVSLVAAGVAFYGFLAFVPLLTALVLTYGLVAEPASVVRHVQALTSIMPADAAKLIGEQLQSMVQTAGTTKGFALLLALAIAIYGAMKGVTSLITALNIAFDTKEERGFVTRTLLALGMTAGTVVALLVGVVATSAMTAAEGMLPLSSPFVHGIVRVGFWLGAAAIISLLIAALYRYAPSRPNAKWRWLSPGSMIATVLWIAGTLGFGFYVSNFGSYNATYGSLGAVIVFLTWLYLSAYLLLLCAELNAETERQTSRDTTDP